MRWPIAALGTCLLATGCSGSPPPPVDALRITTSTRAVATGVPIGEGRVLTVAHVLTGARTVRVDGRRARVLRVDRRLDLAVLGVSGVASPALRTAQAAGVATVHLLRGPITVHVRRRVTAELHDLPHDRAFTRPALELAAAISPGDSGAPVTDARGRLVGIVFARGHGEPATAWAVDVSRTALAG